MIVTFLGPRPGSNVVTTPREDAARQLIHLAALLDIPLTAAQRTALVAIIRTEQTPTPTPTITLTASDPEPPIGSTVLCLDEHWQRTSEDPDGSANWECLDRDDDHETWTKIAGNYGPVTLIETE